MQAKNYTFFFSLKSPFSNFHPAKIEYKEYVFCSNEQFMMFGKAKTFHDSENANKILAINKSELIERFLSGKVSSEEIVNDSAMSAMWNKSMMEIKRCGREVKNYDEKIWCQKREKIVLFGAKEKFKQNQNLMSQLMDSGESIIVEASKYDKIWGIGLTEYDAKRTPPENWPGLNLLGKLLDALKLEFTNSLTKKMRP